MGRPPKMQADAAERTPETAMALVMRSFWPTEENKGRWQSDHLEGAIVDGSVIEVTKDELIDGMLSGRLKPYEG